MTTNDAQSIANWNEATGDLHSTGDSTSRPASPYSKLRHCRTGLQAQDPATTDDIRSLDCDAGGHHDEIVIVFEPHEGSPYSRRYPAHDKYNRFVGYNIIIIII